MIVTNMILTVILLCFVINISKYSEYFDNKCLFRPQQCFLEMSIELEIKDTIDTIRSASYIDLHLEIYNEGRSALRQKRIFQFSHCELSIYM
jgi:hypothetical protein